MTDAVGLSLCCRYAYPPNALSLCGPDRARDLDWYTKTGNTDRGTEENLSQFITLYPYLQLIAGENGKQDPFDRVVVEAYWIGNALSAAIPVSRLGRFLEDDLAVKRRVDRKTLLSLRAKLPDGFAHHAFHVLNTYRRMGYLDVPYTIETMDACLVHWGTVTAVLPGTLCLKTHALHLLGQTLTLEPVNRTVSSDGFSLHAATPISVGDMVSYHWGRYCQTLTHRQVTNLRYFTYRALQLANRTLDV